MNPHATRTSADYTSAFNKFKAEIAKTPSPPVREFRPLKSFPAAPDPRKAEREFYAGLPSRYY